MSNGKYYLIKAVAMVGLFAVVSSVFAQDYGDDIYIPQPYVEPYYAGSQGAYGSGVYGNGFEYYGNGTGGGYGYQNSDGSWYHQSGSYSGGYSVGGDSSGCIYTPDWSNC